MYQKRLEKLVGLQDYFEKEASGKLAQEFIKTNRKYNSPKLAVSVGEYLKNMQSHFFDNVDFNNKKLINSSLLVDKSMEYVFYINSSDDVETLQNLRKKSISELMDKIGDNNLIKSEVLSSLLYALAGQEELVLVDFVKENYYNKLPEEFKSTKFLNTVNDLLKTAIGSVAPNFLLKEEGKSTDLLQLSGSENYIITFWSTTCSHCLKEIPKLYAFTKDMENVKVIAIALEDDKYGFDHHTQDLSNWINVLGLMKWKNQIARDYDIHSTPSYFVLDKDKKIIAKPEELEDVQELFKPEE
jgi:thiol-disulfide isomerase/thioredoxin